MKLVLFVAAGGFAGAITRFFVVNLVQAKNKTPFPFGTLAVNLLGSFLLGILFGRHRLAPEVFFLLGTGFMGSFTTFSTFELESVELIRKDKVWLSITYLLVSTVLGVALALAGYRLAQVF
ncbi:fluoride efflux transporter CrcB [Desulforamulus hydrothermalis]|uniref:Fluoride-specific ion channel FluC n=1 Tax=Desulforamulus hydrothermalis Lam5 = DSM 18033 TaxID=1121428 RepID=K8DZ51_9FIRM|nr:fluoride efflux transporter CrcB [Desulforamulus hydrothermalis]CCO08292.1 Protein CrcB homolog 2 [Desulforamulus hydrothermalis Lam5 = DSM 18033]SHH37908.1 camphor resistance protein CrcB [Desulforamulus hydrothermalis Lam5 = DSM 18033]